MAAPSGTTWGSAVSDKGRIGIYNSITDSGNSITVNTQVWFWSKWTVNDSTNTLYFNYEASSATTSRGSCSVNTTVSTGAGWSTTNQILLGSFTITHTKASSAVSKSVAARLSGIEAVGGDMSAVASYMVPSSSGGSTTPQEPEPNPPVDVKGGEFASNATSGGSVFKVCIAIRVEEKNDTQMRISMWRAIRVVSGDFEGANCRYEGTLGSGTVRLYQAGWYADSGVPSRGWFNRGTTVEHYCRAWYTGGSGTTYQASGTIKYTIPLLDKSTKGITVYDQDGNPHKGIVTYYDENGEPKEIKITAYL